MSPLTASESPTPRPGGDRPVNASNRFGLDYAAEAVALGSPLVPIIDVHSHVNGPRAAAIMRRAMDLYGVSRIYSMTHLEQAEQIRAVLGDRLRLITMLHFAATEDRAYHLGEGYIQRIERYHALGARIAKFWVAPRSVDTARELGRPGLFRLDSPVRLAAMDAAAGLGMAFMVHVADPDTWFATKYRDASIYGTKRQQYEPLEMVLERYRHRPWIAAHMGGWPEDLGFLSGLLARNVNLHLDCSACKWQVRELSKHSRDELVAFLRRFQGRILFGSDIVTTDDHLKTGDKTTEMQLKASSEDEAFDLYASRYWAYRMMFETSYEGESPIVDPDLAMVDPTRFGPDAAPMLRGFNLPAAVLRSIYHDAAAELLDPLHM